MISGNTNNMIMIFIALLTGTGTGIGAKFIEGDALKLWVVEYIKENVPPPEVERRLRDCENDTQNLMTQAHRVTAAVEEIKRLDTGLADQVEEMKAKLWEIDFTLRSQSGIIHAPQRNGLPN